MWKAVATGCLLGLTIVTGCTSPRRGEPMVGSLPTNSPDVVRGQQVFMTHCHQCHPGGEGGLAPAINDKPLPGFLIKFQVRKGIGAMPAFSSAEIVPEELSDLIAYLKALRRRG
jgi:mono/diheme cytochrome c family protein